MEDFRGSGHRALSIRLAPIFFNRCDPCQFSAVWLENRAVDFRAVSTPRNLQHHLNFEISKAPSIKAENLDKELL